MTIVRGDRTIHDELEWINYYNFLESLRQSDLCNMWGAGPYLANAFDLTDTEANAVLCNWIHNYETLNEIYKWQE